MHRLLSCALALSPTAAFAYGEAEADRPSAHERAVHYFTDELRADPGAFDPQFDRPGLRPLAHHSALNDVARLYADDMAENGCFPEDHSSCDGTPASERIGAYYSGGYAENIAYGSPDAWSVVYEGWLYSSGHRRNMLSDALQEIGTGHAPGGGRPLWVQDFGMNAPAEEPILTSGTHWPLRPSAGGDADLLAAAYDPAGESLSAAWVDLNGACRALDPGNGGEGKETWGRTLELPDEALCLPYVFVAETAAGATVEYPTTGSLLLPVGSAECALWTPDRVGSDCVDRVGGEVDDDAGLIAEGAGCTQSSTVDPDGNVTDRVNYASCAAAPGTAGPAGLALLALSGLRRRRA